MKLIQSILIFTIVFNMSLCKNGNNLQVELSNSFAEAYSNTDDTIAHGVAKNGGYYLPDNAVFIFIINPNFIQLGIYYS